MTKQYSKYVLKDGEAMIKYVLKDGEAMLGMRPLRRVQFRMILANNTGER